MNRFSAGPARSSQERFRSEFQRRLRQAMAGHASAAAGFGPAWEAAMEEAPLADEDQAKVYWELIDWIRSDALFTGDCERELLPAWRETVHEF